MKKIITSVLVLMLGFSATQVEAQTDLRKKHFNTNKSGLAIQGYDPVAYFENNKAIEGKESINLLVDGIFYRFSSTQNKELFRANPAKYEPQYGGWCAYAMGASNEKVEIDPATFKILNGKLYLFYHTWVNNTLTKWNKEEATLKAKADNNWTKIYH
ncbi:MAG: YHS domain protein [Sphingobacteriia bacterium]|nr:MAG: YHS domain protein [Sphingobacteriia bacterium]